MATKLVRVGTSITVDGWIDEPVPPKALNMTGLSGDLVYGLGASPPPAVPPMPLPSTTSEERRRRLLALLAQGGEVAQSYGTSTPSAPDWRKNLNTDDDPDNNFTLVVIGNNGLGNIAVPGGSNGVVVGRGE